MLGWPGALPMMPAQSANLFATFARYDNPQTQANHHTEYYFPSYILLDVED